MRGTQLESKERQEHLPIVLLGAILAYFNYVAIPLVVAVGPGYGPVVGVAVIGVISTFAGVTSLGLLIVRRRGYHLRWRPLSEGPARRR